MHEIHTIHPFPARMAPEIALAQAKLLPEGSLVLDPMAGSGTTIRFASELGHRALGFDLDPLAALMSKVWTTPIDVKALQSEAQELVDQAQALGEVEVDLPWLDEDSETSEFVKFWFAYPQRQALRQLAHLLHGREGAVPDALRIALSRIIITKDRGASLARDVSHSRPHRTKAENDFDVIPAFLRSAKTIARRLEQQPPPGGVKVALGDARNLTSVARATVDAAILSPPYLNAIDYMRGHRLSLVWLGYSLNTLRTCRSTSIGAERAADSDRDQHTVDNLMQALDLGTQLPRRETNFLRRYTLDVLDVATELFRVVRSGGRAVFVVGNSCLRGVFIRNAAVVRTAAAKVGLEFEAEQERELPPNRRYLPPPSALANSLDKRMRTECVLSFVRP